MALYTFTLFCISWFAVLHEVFGVPVINRPAGNAPHRQRAKRCACINQLDSECHYFCHLDIMWVNTPSKITVYGLGSPLARRRRSAGRCICANPADQTCYTFCSSNKTAVLMRSFSESLQEFELNPDLHVASENLANAESGIEITDASRNKARDEFMTFLRNFLRSKARAMRMAATAMQKSLRAHKPGPR